MTQSSILEDIVNILSISKRPFKTLAAYAFLALATPAFAQTNATIQGHVNSVPLNHSTQNAKVVVKYTNGNAIDSTATDQNGNYTKNFTVTSVNPTTGLPDRFALSQNYPNPFNPSTKTRIEIPNRTTVHVGIYDILGREIAKKDVMAQPGIIDVDIDGIGAAGIYFLRAMTEDGFSKTIKMVKMDGGIIYPQLKLTQTETRQSMPSLGKLDLVPDSLDIEFNKQGYNANNVRIPFSQSMVVNRDLEKIPTVTDFTLKPILITEDFDGPITSLIVGLKSDSTRQFAMQNGVVRVLFSDYNETPSDTAKFYVVSSDKSLNPYVKIRRQNNPWGQNNLAQNTITVPYVPGNWTNMPDTTKLFLPLFNALGDTANLLLEPSDIEHPYIANRRISTMSDTVRMIFSEQRPQKTGSTQWKPNGSITDVMFLQYGYHVSTGQPISPQDSADVRRSVDNILVEQNSFWGDTLAVFSWYYIASSQDPKIQEASNRGRNWVATYFFNTPTPGNVFDCVAPNTSISRTGSSFYHVAATSGQRFEEIYQMITGQGETQMTWPSGLGEYVFDSSTLGLSKLGKYLMRAEWSSNLGTRRR